MAVSEIKTQYTYMGYTIGVSTEEFSEEDARWMIEDMDAVRRAMAALGVNIFDGGGDISADG